MQLILLAHGLFITSTQSTVIRRQVRYNRHYVHMQIHIVVFLFASYLLFPFCLIKFPLHNLSPCLLTWRSLFFCSRCEYPSTLVPGQLSTVLPLLLSPPRRHPADQVTYLHRQHQQHQPSRLIQEIPQKLYTNVGIVVILQLVDIAFFLFPSHCLTISSVFIRHFRHVQNLFSSYFYFFSICAIKISQKDVLSHLTFVSGRFALPGVLPLRMFCPFGHFVPRPFCLRTFHFKLRIFRPSGSFVRVR